MDSPRSKPGIFFFFFTPRRDELDEWMDGWMDMFRPDCGVATNTATFGSDRERIFVFKME